MVIGQSHGGLTAMAFAAEPYAGVRGVINFAGGLRLSGHDCSDWQDNLVRAFRTFGATAKLPTLWFYGENDSYFDPALAKRLHEAYTGAGGKAKLVAYGRFKGDAHGTFSDREGLAIWWPEVESFLKELGLPTAVLPRPPSDDPRLAALDDLTRLPPINEGCKRSYQLFLDADYPRAYAVSADGHCGYAYGGTDPSKRAVELCQKRAAEACRPYAVNNDIVTN
jgi:hypothetical protein